MPGKIIEEPPKESLWMDGLGKDDLMKWVFGTKTKTLLRIWFGRIDTWMSKIYLEP